MSDDNTPSNEGTVDDSAKALAELADILDDPVTDTKEDEVPAGEPEEKPEAEEAEAKPEGEDPEDSDATETETTDRPRDAKGRFLPLDAEIRRNDGTTTTVKELLASEMRQSDYTRKTTDVARDREEVMAERQRISQTHQALSESQQQISALLEAWKPQPPQNPNDPLSWVNYSQQKEAWEQWQQRFKAESSKAQAALQQQMETERQAVLDKERNKLIERVPALADPSRERVFLGEVVKAASKYGLAEEDVLRAVKADHRIALIMRDLIRAQTASTKAPEVKKAIENKPAPLRGSKRTGQPDNAAAKARAERLANEGTFRAGVASLMDLKDL